MLKLSDIFTGALLGLATTKLQVFPSLVIQVMEILKR